MATTRVIEVDGREQKILVRCLNETRNELIDKGIPTDEVNVLLLRAIEAPTKKEQRRADREGR